MRLYHIVNHTPEDKIAKSIELNGLIPRIASVYKDLVPERIRHLPVVWLTENRRVGLPLFELDSEDLDVSKLHHTAIVYEVDKKLRWWVYQGFIPSNVVSRVQIPSRN